MIQYLYCTILYYIVLYRECQKVSLLGISKKKYFKMFRFFPFFQKLLCITARVLCQVFRPLPLLLVTFQLFWCCDLASKSQQVACVNCGRIVKIPRFGYTFRLAKIEETRSDQEVERNLVISLFTIEFMVGKVSGIDLQE